MYFAQQIACGHLKLVKNKPVLAKLIQHVPNLSTAHTVFLPTEMQRKGWFTCGMRSHFSPEWKNIVKAVLHCVISRATCLATAQEGTCLYGYGYRYSYS